jgi:predicted nuclease of predicted toxin-antitoxin system
MTRFIADENIPSHVIKKLREAEYDVISVAEAASAGIRNYELAELSARIDRVVLTRDADFTRLGQSLKQRMKAIYIRKSGDPHQLADLVLLHIRACLALLENSNVVILDEDGCHAAR